MKTILGRILDLFFTWLFAEEFQTDLGGSATAWEESDE